MMLKKILVAFLVIMLSLTWISRALDSVSVAKVGIGYAKQGSVPYEITGDGTFTAAGFFYINLPEGMLIAEILKKPGEVASSGETILTLQMDRLLEERETLAVSKVKAELLLKEQKLSARTVPKVSEETLALQQLEALQKELESERQELLDAEEEYAVNVENLRQEYVRKTDRSEDEIREELRRELKSAQRAYESAKLARNAAVKKAERTVEEKQKALDRLVQTGAEDEAIEAAQQELSQATEALEETREEHELLVEEAGANLDHADVDFEDRDYNNQDVKDELKKNYDNALKLEEKTLKEAKRNVAAAEESIYQANQKLENAKLSDYGIRSSEQGSLEISQLREQSLALDLSEIEKKLEKIDHLISLDGQITAPVDGIVAKIDLEEGETIASGKQIRLAGDQLKLTALVDKENAKLLKQGTPMEVKKSGDQKPINGVVEYVDYLSEDENAKITASLPEQAGNLGASAAFRVNFQSDIYQSVIPIEALREDSIGYFCLAMEPKKTILGEEMVAVRIDLEILEKSTISCAVSGAVGSKTQLIVSSNKAVGEGDRIRVVKE